MPSPTLSDVHVDAALTNISIGFTQDPGNYIADRVFPKIPVSYRSDKYFLFDKGYFFSDEAKVRADGTESAGGGFSLTTDSYLCDVYAVHKDVGDQIRANADPAVNPDVDATRWVTQQLRTRIERDWVAKYFVTSVWGTTVTGGSNFPVSGTSKWNDDASDPISDISYGRVVILQNTGYMPNKLVLGVKVFEALKKHPLVVDRIKFTGGSGVGVMKVVTEQALAELFEVDEVLVSRAIYNSAAEGVTNSHSFVAADNALLVYAPSAPGLFIPSGGYTFVWSGYTGSNGTGLRISNIPMPWRKANRIEGEYALAQKITASELGYFFLTCV